MTTNIFLPSLELAMIDSYYYLPINEASKNNMRILSNANAISINGLVISLTGDLIQIGEYPSEIKILKSINSSYFVHKETKEQIDSPKFHNLKLDRNDFEYISRENLTELHSITKFVISTKLVTKLPSFVHSVGLNKGIYTDTRVYFSPHEVALDALNKLFTKFNFKKKANTFGEPDENEYSLFAYDNKISVEFKREKTQNAVKIMYPLSSNKEYGNLIDIEVAVEELYLAVESAFLPIVDTQQIDIKTLPYSFLLEHLYDIGRKLNYLNVKQVSENDKHILSRQIDQFKKIIESKYKENC